MKDHLNNRFIRKRLVTIFFSIIMISVVGYLTTQAYGQEQSANNLAERLRHKGVPVQNIFITNWIPVQIEITLQSASMGKELTFDDAWYMILARREALLAYKRGLKIGQYTLVVMNMNQEKISWEQNNIYPEDLSQKLANKSPSKLADSAVQAILENTLDLSGMDIKSMWVLSDPSTEDYGKIVYLEFITKNLETANRSFPPFLNSLSNVVSTLNKDQDAQIILCKLRLVDQEGRNILSYVWDVETRQKQWSAVEGFSNEWYPHPQSTPVPPKITETIAPYPQPEKISIPTMYPVQTLVK